MKVTIKKMFDLSRFEQSLISGSSIIFSGAVLVIIYPNPIAVAILVVVVSHELGHWFKARRHTDAVLPIVLPLGPLLVGMTPVMPTVEHDSMKEIYEGGPRWGLLACAFLGGASTVLASPIILFSSVSLALSELYSITLGSDGSRIKKLKKD